METMELERYIQDAELAFEQKNILDGLGILEEALAIEPNFGKAHNHMGWAYIFHLDDWAKAEKHLMIALKHAPTYGPAYLHMAHILFEKQRFKDLDQLLTRALTIAGVKKSSIFNEFGRMNEVNGRFRKANKQYKSALRWCFDDRELIMIKDSIKRCRQKRWAMLF